jgi:hypothetical protein
LTTYGIEAYTREELEANPNAIISRQPKIVSQFEVDARTSGIRGTAGDDIINPGNGNNKIYAGEGVIAKVKFEKAKAPLTYSFGCFPQAKAPLTYSKAPLTYSFGCFPQAKATLTYSKAPLTY